MKFLRKYTIWIRLMDTLALLGSAATGSMGAMEQWGHVSIQGEAYFSSGILAIVGLVLRIWITDANKDGVVDIFEDGDVVAVQQKTETTIIKGKDE